VIRVYAIARTAGDTSPAFDLNLILHSESPHNIRKKFYAEALKFFLSEQKHTFKEYRAVVRVQINHTKSLFDEKVS